MYGIRLYQNVPAPEPVSSDYLIAAHDYPAWKKNAAGLHPGFDQLRDYPERLPLLGRYDEENPEVTDWEIKWALEHGIGCFLYCWYRYPDNLNRKLDRAALRCGHGLHEGLFRARYGSKMKFAIMWEASARWCATNPEDFLNNLLPFWMEQYFTRENYLVLDRKPVLFIYDYQNRVRDGLGGPAGQAKCFDLARDYARRFGFDGLTILAEYRYPDLSRFAEYRAGGYDSTFAYCWHVTRSRRPGVEEMIRTQMEAMYRRAAENPDFFLPCASKQWDPRPRMALMPEAYGTPETASLWTLDPGSWRVLLEKIKALMDSLPRDTLASRMLLLDNWNEWDEGHYLAPHYEGGFCYLQAVREVFTHRDNLPDYRDPAFLGFGPYDRNWGPQEGGFAPGKRLD